MTSAGQQTPYAVFEQLTTESSEIEKLVVQKLGAKYALGQAMDLQQLGMAEWPRNIAGKISIKDVEAAVAKQVHG